MKRLLGLLLLALALGAGTYHFLRHARAADHCSLLPMRKNAEMEWLQSEFKLTETQSARIAALHEQYQPVCEGLCARIAETDTKVARLIETSKRMTPELEAALRESAEVNAECRRRLLEHTYNVSREMDPGQGARYVRMMRERIVKMGSH